MTKIYIAVASGGSNDDAWESNDAASLDREKIEAFIEKAEVKVKFLNDLYVKVAEFSEKYDVENEEIFKDFMTSSRIPVPKWKPGIAQAMITAEMRAERDRIIDHNEKVDKDATAKWQAYYNTKAIKVLEFVRSQGLTDEVTDANVLHYYLMKNMDVRYHIDEVDQI